MADALVIPPLMKKLPSSMANCTSLQSGSPSTGGSHIPGGGYLSKLSEVRRLYCLSGAALALYAGAIHISPEFAIRVDFRQRNALMWIIS
jgi:hypothetical protein